MTKVNFSSLRNEIKDAAQRAFESVIKKYPNEQFYAFALYSDDGVMTIEPTCNSEEALRDKAKVSGYLLIPDSLRWLTSEWAYEYEGSEYFKAVYRMLNVEGRCGESEFEAFRFKVYETMIEALGDLDAEGFFGIGEKRENITIFCSISDSEDAAQFENESARQLNPMSVYEKFLNRQIENE